MSGEGRSMKTDCFVSGTLSSSSLKETFSQIKHRRGKERGKRSHPRDQLEDTDSDCEICRCSLCSNTGSSRTVRKILTACVLSLVALLGSVSLELSSSLEVWRNTEAALHNLISCRNLLIIKLIGRLQQEREACRPASHNKTLSGTCPQVTSHLMVRINHLCMEVEQGMDVRECADGKDQGCGKRLDEISTALNMTWRKETSDINDTADAAAFSLAITKLMEVWGDLEQDLGLVRLNPDWADVLSLRLLTWVKEVATKIQSSGSIASFQTSWQQTISTLNFAILVSDNLQNCWLENGNLSLYFTQFKDTSLPMPFGASLDLPPANCMDAFVHGLADVQDCLLQRGSQTLKKKSRDFLSAVSLKISLLVIACLIYPIVLVSFKQMTEWIQNYARSLKERTEDLKQERRLAEDLLHQMLPKSVAKQLRRNKHVEAESYERVTIFFSDIVGFTSISASCTPLQVVEMLNNLYVCFDTRIDSYDVYKVETIGDAYMVVSGLPERNGEKHADEIAKMALDLVAAIRQVPIPHMPSKRLQLRAGIHTGPCVAGVVGYKMPRYCLFGDTVNTASRMESTSLPQKVHVSSETYIALTKDDAYELQLRGEIEIKGKGKLKTYWLLGHKNYSVQNDSLVCHWNPNLSRKKKVENASATQSNASITVLSERTTPVSLQDPGANNNKRLDSDEGAPSPLRVSALVQKLPANQKTDSGPTATLGYMTHGVQGYISQENSPEIWPRNGLSRGSHGANGADKASLLPGSADNS
ncbi:hypothetical protein AOXY_G22314 [Acipenser oxyrinchus oxyrinchus]|uniref:guanylate cyclase n=1 Tax=Acipenser oxyrinchus oxyrinchus TaxID=40147 RepID=A0AAD8FZI0_ACIOX|nr:hypothetical protein AOXY_G22314 [Acipenser oxyrinchus oxyrinchus]